MNGGETIYLVDDDAAVRGSLTLLLKAAGRRPVAYDSAAAFLEAYVPGAPGALVVDVRMPGMSGLELQRLLARGGMTIPVIVMTGHGDIAMAVQAIKAGAADFIEKPFSDEVLLGCIERALAMDHGRRREEHRRGAVAARLAALTAREREVMALLVRGKLNKVVAAELGVSTRTVETHRARIMEKLGARSLSDLVRMAMAEGG